MSSENAEERGRLGIACENPKIEITCLFPKHTTQTATAQGTTPILTCAALTTRPGVIALQVLTTAIDYLD